METPPGYSQYPRSPQDAGFGASGRGYRGPGVYFDFITEAFDMIKKNMGVYVLGVFIASILSYLINLPFSFMTNTMLLGSPMGQMDPKKMPEMNYAMFPVAMLISIIPYSISQVINLGVSLCALEEADTGSTSINTMFSGFRNFVPVAVTSLLYVLAVYVGLALCIVPGIYVAGALAFAPIIAAKEGLGPIQAMQRSYEMLKPHAWLYFCFMLVAVIVSFLGIIACCIGIIFTMPVMHICMALHYREFRGPLNQGFVAPQVP
jgi:hypothetical protein